MPLLLLLAQLNPASATECINKACDIAPNEALVVYQKRLCTYLLTVLVMAFLQSNPLPQDLNQPLDPIHTISLILRARAWFTFKEYSKAENYMRVYSEHSTQVPLILILGLHFV